MKYDFTTVHPDRQTDCEVYTLLAAHGVKAPDAIPFAVAEMMFEVAPPIRAAMHACVDNGYFGYRQNEAHFRRAVCDWMGQKGVSLTPEQLLPSYGVVVALGNAVRAFSKPGDAVVVQPPVYGPFYGAIRDNGRVLVENPLVEREGRFVMDLADLEQKLRATRATLLILCSPHNPVGRVWSGEELTALHTLCKAYGVSVLADEIHQDILPFGAVQTPYATIDPDCVAMSAASKTFNIAGLATAYVYSQNTDMLARYAATAHRDSGEFFNPVGMAATTAAYTEGEAWMREMLAKVAQNALLLRERLVPLGVKVPPLEGTYLCWLDMRPLGLDGKELEALLVRAGLELTPGEFFGTEGAGCARFNVACPTAPLSAGLDRLRAALGR